jgi:type IV pilus assembly protein PilB
MPSEATIMEDRGAAATNDAPAKPLGQRLLDAGLIDEQQLDLALREQKRQGRKLGEVLIDLGFVAPGVITDALASEAKTQVVDVLGVNLEPELMALVDYDTARRHRVVPLEKEGNTLTIALADAFDVVAIDQIEKATGLLVRVVTAAESDILEALALYFAQGRSINETIDRIMRDGVDTDDEEDELVDGSPMIRLVDQIIALGIKQKATDIHIEPDDKILRIRLRVDGVLHQEVLVPKPIQPALIARLKLMAGLDITEKRSPQDGRIRFVNGQSEVDLRASTLPTNHGESVVLRILNAAGVTLSLEHLGFSANDRERFSAIMQRPYGMVLVTGPTGSGKTTTLYTALSQVDAQARSVFTLEDPIEYAMGGIRQTQIRPEVGMDFASGLRALLRQDPDVILVGEIRDMETAQLATRAALTGHLVLSTLHTNTAAGVIPRLIDMGVERYLLPAALSAVIGQRLVRRICEQCKGLIPDTEAELAKFDLGHLLDAGAGTAQLWKGAGCDACRNTGYKGRQAIYEVMIIDETFHAAIIDEAPTTELEQIARAGGMKTMLEDGVGKALDGLTTVEEVLRIVR